MYKPSGAGGGDVGVLFARSERDLEAALRAARESGFPAIPVALDPEGVCVHVADQDQGS